MRTVSAATLVLAAGIMQVSWAAELQPGTVAAWNAYIKDANLHMQDRAEGRGPFLWLDESSDRAARVREGEVLVAPVRGRGTQPVTNGLIHDWIGGVFIRSASNESLLKVVHDYDCYKDIYKPVVTDSRSLEAGGAEQEFSMAWHKHVLFVSAAMKGRYHAQDVVVDSHRGYSIVESTTLQQVDDFGRPSEHVLPPDTGLGFIWRIYSIARYEQRDGGVYLEIEALALTRDIPASMRWLVNPVVNHLSVNSLTTTLVQTREAVNSQQAADRRLVAKGRKGLN